ncbi:MAG: hypothetical protein MUE53_09045 [Chitinophagales bacterium]|jgi:hypothetical protein|nr:hypothetical protein [Chitinophagales bacterium]
MGTINWRALVGYSWKDNVFIGFITSALSVGIVYYLQVKHYQISVLAHEHSVLFTFPLLKRSLLGVIPVFFLFNFMDLLYSLRGVLFFLFGAALFITFKYVI